MLKIRHSIIMDMEIIRFNQLRLDYMLKRFRSVREILSQSILLAPSSFDTFLSLYLISLAKYHITP